MPQRATHSCNCDSTHGEQRGQHQLLQVLAAALSNTLLPCQQQYRVAAWHCIRAHSTWLSSIL
jgi:hypothetical protein